MNAADRGAVGSLDVADEFRDVAGENLVDGLGHHFQCQAVAGIGRNQLRPGRVIAPHVALREQRPARGDAQAFEYQHPDQASLTAELCQLRRRLAAGQYQAALVGCLTQRLHERSVAGQPAAVAAVPLAGLEQRLEVVQHQQAPPLAQQAEQCCDLLRLIRRRHQAPVRQEADGAGQPLACGWRVAQTAPVHVFEALRDLLAKFGGQTRLADATRTQYADQAATLTQDPISKGRELFLAADEIGQVGRIAPVLVALGGEPQVLGLDRSAAAMRGPACQQPRKPALVERGMHPRGIAQCRCPQRFCLVLLRVRGEAIRFEQGPDECLQRLRAWVIDACLPILERAPAHPHACRKLSLGQGGPPAVTQEQAAEALRRSIGPRQIAHQCPTSGRTKSLSAAS